MNRIRSLDGLRGFAALYVVLGHYGNSAGIPFRFSFFRWFSFASGSSVPLFFCLSGFLIHQIYQGHKLKEQFFHTNFYLRRLFRILPLWWAILICAKLIEDQSYPTFFYYFTFGFGIFPKFYWGIMAIGWSLFVEEVFYLLFPFVSPFLTTWTNAIKWFLAAALLSSAWLTWASKLGVPTDYSFISLFPLAKFQFFFLGIAYSIYRGVRNQEPSEGKWKITFLDILALLTFFSAPLGLPSMPEELSVALIAIATLEPGTFLGRIFRFPLLCWWGRHCYFIYLSGNLILWNLNSVHGSVIDFFHLNGTTGEINILIRMALFLAVVSPLAAFSSFILEKPLQKIGLRLIKRREAAFQAKN